MYYNTNYCEACGVPCSTLETHHLIMGSRRKLADEDKLYIRICRNCHNNIHSTATGEALSKMLGQALYEKNHSKEEFKKRYGINYLP